MLVRRLEPRDLAGLNRWLPVWNDREYARRLLAQDRGQMLQGIAWIDDRPVGRGMVLFPEHDEFSASAVREGCAEVRDVFVVRARRRLGIATDLMGALEESVRDRGMISVGLSVALDEEAAQARSLYEGLGYRYAHGPFVSSSTLASDDGPLVVGAVLTYLVKDL